MLTVKCERGIDMFPINDLSGLINADNLAIICWLVALVLFLVIEIITLGLTTIWFAGGALVSFFAALMGMPVLGQIFLFFGVSFVLLIFTRPLVQKRLNNSREKTNVNSVIGREGKVIEEVDNFNEKGRILIGGMEWMARSSVDGVVIPMDACVIVKEIRGVKAIVALAKEE